MFIRGDDNHLKRQFSLMAPLNSNEIIVLGGFGCHGWNRGTGIKPFELADSSMLVDSFIIDTQALKAHQLDSDSLL